MQDTDLNKRAADLLTALIFGYATYIDEQHDQARLMAAHSTLNNARNLIDALQRGRVKIVKTDQWSDD